MTVLAPTPAAPGDARPRRWGRRRVVGVAALVLVLVAAAVLSVTFGARDVAPADVWAGLTGSTDTASAAAVAKRVPRTLLAILVGAALAVSGAVLQGATRNPLADPQILGINGGAGLAIVIGIAFFGLGSATAYI